MKISTEACGREGRTRWGGGWQRFACDLPSGHGGQHEAHGIIHSWVDPVTEFCNQCAGPFDGWLAEDYGGHWDTCPNRTRGPKKSLDPELSWDRWNVYGHRSDGPEHEAFMAGWRSVR